MQRYLSTISQVILASQASEHSLVRPFWEYATYSYSSCYPFFPQRMYGAFRSGPSKSGVTVSSEFHLFPVLVADKWI